MRIGPLPHLSTKRAYQHVQTFSLVDQLWLQFNPLKVFTSYEVTIDIFEGQRQSNEHRK